MRIFKSNRTGSCICFFVVVAIALSSSGCCTKPPNPDVSNGPITPARPGYRIMIPITDELIAEVAAEGKTPDSFQYYISKTITLSLVGGQKRSDVNDEGQMIRIGSTIRETIGIQAYKHGIIRQQYPSGYTSSNLNNLSIAFEKYEGDYPEITFAKRGYGPTARYEILYTEDPTGKKINYGGIDYYVTFNDPDELPYLMITIDEKATNNESPNSREVSGLWLHER